MKSIILFLIKFIKIIPKEYLKLLNSKGIVSKIEYTKTPRKINKTSETAHIDVTINTKFFLDPVQLQKDFEVQLLD